MSYLNPLRLHFAGQFQANVSTVNNDPDHFNNAGFQPSYQEMQGPDLNPPNGWFNPQGDAAFRLQGCQVTAAWTPDGPVTSDPVLGYIVADSDEAVPAKLVDLDPEQQLVSEIWGLTVRIADSDGNTLMSAQFEPAAFMDIWTRSTDTQPGSDISAGAAYQSVLTDVTWGDVSGSAFLTKLQQATVGGMLSIKFNVDGLNMTYTDPDFMCGRIAGTIGPAAAGEPQHLVIGRQFMADVPPSNNFPVPSGGINFFPAVIEDGHVYLDLGNALSTSTPGGPINDVGDLALSVYDPLLTPTDPAGSLVPIGTIPASVYTGPDWYSTTAGVVVLALPSTPIPWLGNSPLILSGNEGISISEASSGAWVRADRFVYRMSPGDEVSIPFYATQWGKLLAGAQLSFVLDPSQLQLQASSFLGPAPGPGTPTDALTFNSTAPADGGVATLTVTAGDPGTPRWFNNGADYGIDGQVYGIRASFSDPELNDGPVNQWNFVSFLLWSGFTAADPVTWTEVQPIFQQYANLYPVMLRFLNLADYDDVVANADLLQLAFGLDEKNPNVMPVTRDLSPAKRSAILSFLGNPQPGEAPPQPAPAAAAAAQSAGTPPQLAAKGGKGAAMARRLVLQTR